MDKFISNFVLKILSKLLNILGIVFEKYKSQLSQNPTVILQEILFLSFSNSTTTHNHLMCFEL